MRYIGVTTSINAEFWVLRDGLKLASQMGITHLAVESDAKVNVDLVLLRKTPNSSCTSLLNNCRYLLNQFQRTKIRHIYREANKGVDYLAKKACELVNDVVNDFVVLNAPPSPDLDVILSSDIQDLYSLRLTANMLTFITS
nr:uncharacterized protein LOC112026315 [Quercus suber]